MSNSPITNECPYCSHPMRVSQCTCEACQVKIEGDFPSIPLGNLPTAHQRFIEMFVLASGNLKEIATLAGVSYPTVRSRLDKVITALREEIEAQQNSPQSGKESKPSKRGSGKGQAHRRGESKSAKADQSPSVADIIKQI